MRDRIIAYLGQGFSPADVASMAGCTLALVTQLQTEEAVAIQKEKEKIHKKREEDDIEKGYVRLETRVQHAIEAQLPFAEFGDLTKAMGVLIQRRQKAAYVPQGIVHDNRTQVVVLNVPQAALPEFTLNAKKEIIAVGGKALAAMPSSSVRELFSRLESSRPDRVSELLPALPASLTFMDDVEDAEEVVLGAVPDDF